MKKANKIVMLCSAIALVLLFAMASAACGGELERVPEWIEVFGIGFKNGKVHEIIITEQNGEESTKTTIKLFEDEKTNVTNYKIEEISESNEKQIFYYKEYSENKIVRYIAGSEANSWVKYDVPATEISKFDYDFRKNKELFSVVFDYKNYVFDEDRKEFIHKSIPSLPKVDGDTVKSVIFRWSSKEDAEAVIEIGEEEVERKITITIVLRDPKFSFPTTNVIDGTMDNLNVVLTKIKENVSSSVMEFYIKDPDVYILTFTRMVTEKGEQRMGVIGKEECKEEWRFFRCLADDNAQWEEYERLYQAGWTEKEDEYMKYWLVEEDELFSTYLLNEEYRSFYVFDINDLAYNFNYSDWGELDNNEENHRNYVHKLYVNQDGWDVIFTQTWIMEDDVPPRYTKMKIEEVTEIENWPGA